MLERSDNVVWWYKNGEDKDRYFAIPYEANDEETNVKSLRGFYADIIVRFKDGRIGIYDTKAGMTVTDKKTYAKSDALQACLAEHDNLTGGILNKRSDSMYIFEGDEYTPNLDAWTRFIL